MTPVERARHAGGVTFASLSIPNYRRYYGGQSVSLIGTWMQMTAQSWLVLRLSHSSTMLGLVVALQTLPVLVLGPYGGVIADRVDKRRLMVALQTVMGLQALALGVLTVTGTVRVWQIGILAAVLGLNNAFENPARQSFMMELVGPEHLRNAVSLNSVLVNAARSVGPAVAGILIATVGTGVCFLVNAGSFAAVVFSLTSLDGSALAPSTPAPRAGGQLREGLRYVRSTPALAIPLVMMGIAGCLTYEFQVSLPVMADQGLHVGATGFGFMTAAMGIGAVAGGLFVAGRGTTGLRPLVLAAAGFAVALAVATLAPSLAFELIALALVGAGSIAFMSTGNSTLQLTAAPEMRGRVMSLWFVAFQGSTPIGGPIVGATMALLGARAGLGLGALTAGLVACGGFLALRRRRGRSRRASARPGRQHRLIARPRRPFGGARSGKHAAVITSLLDTALDRTVLAGYTNVGYAVRRRWWRDDALGSMSGRSVLVTGATSGLGLAAAEGFARLGADVWLVARDAQRGERVRAQIAEHCDGSEARLELCDLAKLDSVRDLARRVSARTDRLHVLVHNAGVMPEQRTLTEDGIELTFAVNVVAPFALTRLLADTLAAGAPARIITVASGGMYTQRLHADDLQNARGEFSGATAYARTKRAEVILTELWARRLADRGIVVHAMHPGWADTPGISESLPRFYRVTRPLLRTPAQGADTIVWLGAADEPARSTGGFWHDRRRRPTSLLPWTRETAADREALWQECERLTAAPAES